MTAGPPLKWFIENNAEHMKPSIPTNLELLMLYSGTMGSGVNGYMNEFYQSEIILMHT